MCMFVYGKFIVFIIYKILPHLFIVYKLNLDRNIQYMALTNNQVFVDNLKS